MSTEINKQSRRKFLGWGLASAAVFSAVKFMLPTRKKPQTVKMLGQDGKLVEVDMAALSSTKKKVTNSELQNWIKK
jgi:hypothetical protein